MGISVPSAAHIFERYAHSSCDFSCRQPDASIIGILAIAKFGALRHFGVKRQPIRCWRGVAFYRRRHKAVEPDIFRDCWGVYTIPSSPAVSVRFSRGSCQMCSRDVLPAKERVQSCCIGKARQPPFIFISSKHTRKFFSLILFKVNRDNYSVRFCLRHKMTSKCANLSILRHSRNAPVPRCYRPYGQLQSVCCVRLQPVNGLLVWSATAPPPIYFQHSLLVTLSSPFTRVSLPASAPRLFLFLYLFLNPQGCSC